MYSDFTEEDKDFINTIDRLCNKVCSILTKEEIEKINKQYEYNDEKDYDLSL